MESEEPGSEPLPPAGPAFWRWRGHRIRWLHRPGPGVGCGGTSPQALLIHGFGANLEHWRHTAPALAERVDVYALDLLGFGGSDKPPSRLKGELPLPGSEHYCFDLWSAQVVDFVESHLPPGELHLVGNSIGGVVALAAALLLEARGRQPAQVVLIDCAQRALDEKLLAELPAWERAGRPLLKRLVRQRRLIAPLFRLLARPAMVRRVLAMAYPSGGNVDEELVDLLLRPARDPGALESFRGFVNIFDDLLAPDLLAQLDLPVRMVWGEKDPWENPEVARRWQRDHGCVRELRVLEGLGHCPHDEDPARVNPILLDWIAPLQDQCTCATT